MSTTTLQPNLPALNATPAVGTLRDLLRRIEATVAAAPSAEELLELAALYEAGQPSYAADLRAAAAALEGADA